jgi:hypothetical protein
MIEKRRVGELQGWKRTLAGAAQQGLRCPLSHERVRSARARVSGDRRSGLTEIGVLRMGRPRWGQFGRTSICIEGDGSRSSIMIVFKCEEEVMYLRKCTGWSGGTGAESRDRPCVHALSGQCGWAHLATRRQKD